MSHDSRVTFTVVCSVLCLQTPMLDCLGNPQNIKEAIDHVARQRPASSIVLLGVSMGG